MYSIALVSLIKSEDWLIEDKFHWNNGCFILLKRDFCLDIEINVLNCLWIFFGETSRFVFEMSGIV